MFVLCVLYSKDKRQSQDNQDKEVYINYREQKKFPFGVLEIFGLNSSGRTMALGSTQPLTEMSTRDLPWG